MSADDGLLVGMAAVLFSIFGLVGWLLPQFWIWRWADVIYYPLAAIGIVLLFFTNDVNRSVLRIEAKQVLAEQAWREHPNPRPDVVFDTRSADLLEARYGWLDVTRRLGEACTMSAIEGCGAYRGHAEALRETFGDFSIPPNGDAVAIARAEEAFCKAGFAYIDQLAENSILALGAYDRLKVALRQLSKGRDEAQLNVWLDQKMTEEQRLFATHVKVNEREIAAPYIRAEAEHSLALFGNLNWCATRDNRTSHNLKVLDAWHVEEVSRTQARARYARELESARKNKPRTPMQQASSAVHQQWWPYILILALSLKFGKAMTAIGDDLNKWVKLVGSALQAIVCYLQRFRRSDSKVSD